MQCGVFRSVINRKRPVKDVYKRHIIVARRKTFEWSCETACYKIKICFMHTWTFFLHSAGVSWLCRIGRFRQIAYQKLTTCRTKIIVHNMWTLIFQFLVCTQRLNTVSLSAAFNIVFLILVWIWVVSSKNSVNALISSKLHIESVSWFVVAMIGNYQEICTIQTWKGCWDVLE